MFKKGASAFLLCWMLLDWCSSHGQDRRIRNLVFEGAGIRGIAYSGAIRELEKEQVLDHVKQVGGTSAGAITALMVSLGYSSDEICSIISATGFQKFNDGQFLFIGGIHRLKNRYGWYRGRQFDRWLGKIIGQKTGNADITFSELRQRGFRSLYVTATCLNRQRLVVFSHHTYPNMKVRDAVRASMSVPLYFEAVFVDSTGRSYRKPIPGVPLDIMIDGGLLGNFPISLFDSIVPMSDGTARRIPDFSTLGIRIDSDQQISNDTASGGLASIEVKSFRDYLHAFYLINHESLNRMSLIPADWQRTVSVSSCGIGPRVRRLSQEEKELLIRSGETHTREYLARLARHQP